MTKKNEILKLDFDSYISTTESMVCSDPSYQEALKRFNEVYNSLKENNSSDIAMEVDNVVTYLETAVREAVYKKAFEAGMRFILNTMAGKEVIEII